MLWKMEATWELAGRSVVVKNLETVFFPETGITKGDLLTYYRRVAGAMLPHLEGRPLTLYQCPDGIEGHCFYRRKLPEHAPEWFRRVFHDPRTKTGRVPLILVEDEAQLIWLANQAAIEFHAWNARLPHLDRPDRLIFDLDPGEVGFELVLKAAVIVHEELASLGLSAWPKTSGGRGLHLFVPLKPEKGHTEVRAWARAFAERVEAKHGFVRLPKGRSHEGRSVQIDYAQNGYGRNTAAPYTVRARPGAPVSTPLFWNEVRQGEVDPTELNLRSVPARLEERGDPWQDLPNVAFRLPEL